MTKLQGFQLSIVAELECDDRPVGDWDYDELGTNKILVPNLSPRELGTNKVLVPNSSPRELGTNKVLVPNSSPRELGTNKVLVPKGEDWKPPIGCLQQKWIKDHQYWYWRYYKTNGKKGSIYLGKDYNKAIQKVIKIGIPANAKAHHPSLPPTDPQVPIQIAANTRDLAQTAHGASGHPIAA